jgi:hypothetical protein
VGLSVVTPLNWIPKFEWCMARLVFNNGQKRKTRGTMRLDNVLKM